MQHSGPWGSILIQIIVFKHFWGGSDLYKMFTIMKMVITGVENWSPDMIPVAFDRKFDELLNEIPPGIYRDHIVDFFQYWGWED